MISAGARRGLRQASRFILTILVVLFVMLLTLTSAVRPPGKVAAPFLCLLACRNEGIRDLVSNIILFLPVGWVARHWVSPRIALFLCLAATIGIEASQAFLLVGRDPSLRDILTNTGGGFIGIWLYAHWREVLHPSPAAGRRLAVIAGLTWLLVLIVTGLGIHAAPTSRPWYGQWAADLGQYAKYQGEVQEVLVGDWTPPSTLMAEPQPIRAGLARDSLQLVVIAVSGERPPRAAPMFSVYDDAQQEQLFVGQNRYSLQLQVRTRFDQWELRGIALRLPLYPGPVAGERLTITATVSPHQWTLAAQSPERAGSAVLPLTLGLGWNALLPIHFPLDREWMVLNALWLAGLIAPAAYWFQRAAPKRALLYGVPAVAVVLVLLPTLLHIAPTAGPDWIGTAAGTAWGVLFAYRSRHRHAVGPP